MRGEILGFERRRRWSDEEKLGIVMALGVDDATVTQVAQRHEITRQQIYAWRHEMKKKGLWSPDGGGLFLPFDIPAYGVPTIADTPIIAAMPPLSGLLSAALLFSNFQVGGIGQ
jgi:transposase